MQRTQRHEWKVETEEGIRLYRAVFHSKEWKFSTGMKGVRSKPTEWTWVDNPTNEEWESLREVLFKKYQRKRCPWKLITDIDKKLGRKPQDKLGGSPQDLA